MKYLPNARVVYVPNRLTNTCSNTRIKDKLNVINSTANSSRLDSVAKERSPAPRPRTWVSVHTYTVYRLRPQQLTSFSDARTLSDHANSHPKFPKHGSAGTVTVTNDVGRRRRAAGVPRSIPGEDGGLRPRTRARKSERYSVLMVSVRGGSVTW